jgi:hypothetical protein
MKGFMDCQQRLAYLLSQGDHRCDVAILYPVAPMQAGMDGQRAVNTAFEGAEALHAQSIDFDFMDFQSLDRAEIVGSELHVSGNIYKALVLPGMKAIRHSTLKKRSISNAPAVWCWRPARCPRPATASAAMIRR